MSRHHAHLNSLRWAAPPPLRLQARRLAVRHVRPGRAPKVPFEKFLRIGTVPQHVMAGLVPAIHVVAQVRRVWRREMPGTSPGMTMRGSDLVGKNRREPTLAEAGWWALIAEFAH